MATLTKQARETIKNYWYTAADGRFDHLTIVGYVRHEGYESVKEWGGDVCGCPDDRCANGFHHMGVDDCGCLPVLLDMYAEELVTGVRAITCACGDR